MNKLITQSKLHNMNYISKLLYILSKKRSINNNITKHAYSTIISPKNLLTEKNLTQYEQINYTI